jgi:hypothetical protein
MKIRNPLYLLFALLVSGYVVAANYNGWSLVQSVAAQTVRHLSPNTQHK